MTILPSYGVDFPGGTLALERYLHAEVLLSRAKSYFLKRVYPLRLMPPTSEAVGKNALQLTHEILIKKDATFVEFILAAERIELALTLIKNKLFPSNEDLQFLNEMADCLVAVKPRVNLLNQKLPALFVKALWSRYPYCTPYSDPSVIEYGLIPSDECRPEDYLNEKVYIAPQLSMRPFLVKNLQKPSALTAFLAKDPTKTLVILDDSLPFRAIEHPFVETLSLLGMRSIKCLDSDRTHQWAIYPCPLYLDQWIARRQFKAEDWQMIYVHLATIFDAEKRLGLRLISDHFEEPLHLFFFDKKENCLFPANSLKAFQFLKEAPRERFLRFTQHLDPNHALFLQEIYSQLPIHPHEKFVNCLYQLLIRNILHVEPLFELRIPPLVRQLWELSKSCTGDMEKLIPWHRFTNGGRQELPKFLHIFKAAHPILENEDESKQTLLASAKRYLTAQGARKKEFLQALRHRAANYFVYSFKDEDSACQAHAEKISRILTCHLKCDDQLDYIHLWKPMVDVSEIKEQEDFLMPILIWHALLKANKVNRKALDHQVQHYLKEALKQQSERENLKKAKKIWHNLRK